MMNNDKQIAATILEQLGGQKFVTMTGCHSFTADKSALIFKVPAKLAKNKIKAVKITLTPADTYTVTFFSISKTSVKVVATHEDVYEDNLRSIFEAETGLLTSL